MKPLKGKYFLCLYGVLYSKSNSRQFVMNRKTGKMFLKKSDNALKTVKDYVMQIRSKWKREPLDGLVGLRAVVYYPSRRHDLDIALLCDILQEAKVFGNDRQIVYEELLKRLDTKNPRVEMTIENYKEKDTNW